VRTFATVAGRPESLPHPIALLEATVGAEVSDLKLTMLDTRENDAARREAAARFRELLPDTLRVLRKNRAEGSRHHPQSMEPFTFRGLLYEDGNGEFGAMCLHPDTGTPPEGSLEYGIESVITALDAL